jgi:hypothetical protein
VSKDRKYHDVAGTVWQIRQNDDGSYSIEQATFLVLQDIRAELQKLNATLRCSETQRIPRYLRRIASNTAKPRKKP